jgi:hypothetical protein
MPRAIVGRKTVIYAWAGIRNVLYLSLEAGANASVSIKTSTGRQQVVEVIILTAREPPPPGSV